MPIFRALQIKLAGFLKKEVDRCGSKRALAREIGISPGKLEKIINDEWDYITRDAIERVADHYSLEVSQIFDLSEIEFWRPIEDRKTCTFVRGSHSEVAGVQRCGFQPMTTRPRP